MKRRNYTREILAQMAEGKVPVNSVGPERPVTYDPRSKADPKPWTNGVYRYSGREVHTVPATCGEPLAWGGSNPCARPKGHNGMCHD